MKLFEPLQINRMRLENRILLTAMVTRLSSEDGYVNQPIMDRYLRFAQGETGLIVVEATAVHAAKSGPLLRLSDGSFIPGHRDLTRRIHAASRSKVALQIIHFLKIARSGWRQTVDLLSQADIIGFARALLADPDWPKKARLGQAERIVRCVYGNVCKALDENFKQVKCTLWLKHGLHPPEPPAAGDESPPTWPAGGQLRAICQPNGRVLLSWERAEDPQGVYGYEIFRAVNDGRFVHLTSATTSRHADDHALAGNSYAYQIKAYDFAGNRSEPSQTARVEIPLPPSLAVNTLCLNGEIEAEMGYAA